MHAKIDVNSQIIEYPITDIRALFPDMSLPEDLSDDTTLPSGYVYVRDAATPEYDPLISRLELGAPVSVDGKWQVSYNVVALDADQLAVQAKAVQQMFMAAAQARLDAFAQTRFYDSMLSACTYATSKVPRLAAEGQYCVDARDTTWETLYAILGAVQAGTRETPSAFSDIAGELPVLEWPAV